MQCPRCGANGIDAQGFCANCRLFRGVPGPAQPPAQPGAPGRPPTPASGPQPTNGYPATSAQPAGPATPGPATPGPAGATGAFPAAAPGPATGGVPAAPAGGPFPAAYGRSPTSPFPPVPPTSGGGYPPGHPGVPAPRPRNPLLIPGLIFGVVALLLVGAVIVYAATSGGEEDALPAAAPSVTSSASAAASASPAVTAGPSATATAEPSASASPSASAAADAACVYGVWLEEQHDEQVTVLNTGVFPFRSSGTFQRYSDTGRAVFDYGNGVHLTGTNGTSTFDYVFSGYISYTFKVENGMVVYGDPRPNGTETFFRNGVQDYSGKLLARVPQPMKINCGSVAMSLTNPAMTVQMRRTSSAP
ncbi:hypothetical protein ACFFX1_02855 [Dactylosporangium sucinum]|uniref:Uncharacterized protein n=1 Tax=Dactylosporangium sucinum TaxID=1424081 RepID=A0A917U9T0_9ACTN|nr:hypothetical protein [Dactylosporangium sucinum]GGM65312.1 hypothetical protein GCM10007977_078540 [Dactylosporangium sucinum]